MSKLDILDDDNITEDLRLSYSRISKFSTKGPKELNEDTRTKTENKGTSFGKLVDILESNVEEFKNKYIIFEGNELTASVLLLAQHIVLNYDTVPSVDKVLKIARELKIWSRIKDRETFINRFDFDDFWNYIKVNIISKTENKEIININDYLDAKETVSTLRTYKYTKHIFNPQKKYIESLNQFEINFEYNNFKFKGIVDKIIINHKDKTIQLIDLKTGIDPIYKFEATFIKYRYYLQEAVYSKSIDYIKKELGIEDYQSLPFQFVYIKRGVQIPVIYTVTDKWHKAALFGFTTDGGYKYKGLNELLEEISWHWKNKEFVHSKEFIDNKGNLKLKDDFINIKI